MKAIIDAIIAALTQAGYPVYYGDATGATTFPYVLLWGTAGDASPLEPALAGLDEISDLLGVTVVDTTTNNCLISVIKVRSILHRLVLEVAGRKHTELRLAFAGRIDVDRDVTMPKTSAHPAFCPERYQLISQ